jgi:hypothetical protein
MQLLVILKSICTEGLLITDGKGVGRVGMEVWMCRWLPITQMGRKKADSGVLLGSF